MRTLLILFWLAIAITSVAQNNYITYNRQTVNMGPPAYLVNSFVNIFNDIRRERIAKEEAFAKMDILRKNYDSYESHPDSITTGWHNVIVTDNLKFCRDAKVYVANNRIREFVIENCIPLTFTSTGLIKKGKAIVTLERTSGDPLEVVDVYFMYDLDEPVLASPPIEPGYVCFWASKSKYLNRKLIIDGMVTEGVPMVIKKEPQCFDPGTFSMVMKPGTYKFTAQKAGNDRDGVIVIKSGQCLKFELF